MTKTETIKLMNNVVEEVETQFYGEFKATERDGYWFIQSMKLSPNTDSEELEDSMLDLVEHLRNEFNIDLDIEYINKRTVVYSVIAY